MIENPSIIKSDGYLVPITAFLYASLTRNNHLGISCVVKRITIKLETLLIECNKRKRAFLREIC